MPYWSKGIVGIKRGGYTGPQVYNLNDDRPMHINLQSANHAVQLLLATVPAFYHSKI